MELKGSRKLWDHVNKLDNLSSFGCECGKDPNNKDHKVTERKRRFTEERIMGEAVPSSMI